MRSCLQRQFVGYFTGICGVTLLVCLIEFFLPGLRLLAAACILFVLVLLVGANWGVWPALLTSTLGAISINYFFVSPLHALNFRIDGSEDEIALLTFVITSVTAGRLFSHARQRAAKIRVLYDELRDALDQTTRLEVTRRSERFKSALLDSVTHDLRTPLTSIKCASTTILDMRGELPSSNSVPTRSSESDLLQVIVHQTNRLNNFVDGLIELASVEAPGVLRPSVSTPMEEVIGAAISRASDALRDYNLEVNCGEGLRTSVNGKAVAQVVFSFLENAGKYAPKGTKVRVLVDCDADGRVRTAVEDEGPGVPIALRTKIFDKFFRGEPTESGDNVVGGLGLGLAIAKEIAEVNGGEVWVEERAQGERGARFVFLLPSENLTDAPPAEGGAQ